MKGYIFLFVFIFFLARAPQNVVANPVKKDPLKQIDVLFRSTYNQARKEILLDAGPIIIASGEDLTLLWGDKEIKGGSPPPSYRALTTVSHLTLTIFLLLEPYGEGEVSPERLERLKQLSRLALAAKQTVAKNLAANSSLADEQQTLIDISRSFIEQIVSDGVWRLKELEIF